MWGDWVNHNGNPRRIKGAVDFTFAKDFEPIPLTAERLEKNGFTYVPFRKRWIIDGELELIEDRMGDMEIEYWFSVSDQYICPNHFVHELQRAMRCCGLWDMAENFKV